jgi:L-malate glycosyltransferase
LLVGRVAYGKGHSDAIDACEFALQQGLDVTLQFVGNIENQKLFTELTKKLDMSAMKDKCYFLGHHNDVSPFYESAHILLFPSLGEGLPGVLLEAFQYGVFPITYNNTVFPEFLKLGFKFPQVSNKSVPELQKALVNAIQSYSNLQQDISNNYTLAKEIFSFERIRKEYISILK